MMQITKEVNSLSGMYRKENNKAVLKQFTNKMFFIKLIFESQNRSKAILKKIIINNIYSEHKLLQFKYKHYAEIDYLEV